jgi:UDP-3-O-[3-hydroxymyristoyl] glucosamine N-acyltransferase
MALTLQELAQQFGLEWRGDGAQPIDGVCALDPGVPGRLGFVADARLRPHLRDSRAAALVLTPALAEGHAGNVLLAKDPALAFARIAALFDPRREFQAGRHPSAVIDASASIAESAWIGPGSVVGARVVIGPQAYVGAQCVLEDEVVLGEGARLAARVFVGRGCVAGARLSVEPGAVIGGRGFGLARGPQGWESVPQLGRVQLGDDVEIGANTTIDRGALDDTEIGDGVKLDNQIQIAHNCRIGAHTAIASCVGIAGSTRIGARCMIGGACGIAGHIEIGDDVILLAGAMVTKSIRAAGVYGGILPAMPAGEWRKLIARLRGLDELRLRMREIARKLGISSAATGERGDSE